MTEERLQQIEQERDALRGEVVALREALEFFVRRYKFREADPNQDLAETDEEAQAIFRAGIIPDHLVLAATQQALEASPYSAKLAAVVAAAEIFARWQQDAEATGLYATHTQPIIEAVDALREAQEVNRGTD